MTRSPCIRVDNLGKRFRVRGPLEQQRTAYRYVALRDVISERIGRIARGLIWRSNNAQSSHHQREQDFWALKDVSFEITEGEAVGIIGRNGAGKSTLLKLLSRITEPSLGWIGLKGRVASLLEVGTGFHPELTGRENIYLNGVIMGMRRQEVRRKFDEIVAFAELDRFIDMPVKRYSSGMYMRLAFSVAAHLEPDILVVDEVLAVGDAQFQTKCLGKMSAVAQAGRTVLFVSHNMPAIVRLCQRAILLSNGRLVNDGPPSEVTSAYLSGIANQSGIRKWEKEDCPGGAELRLVSVGVIVAGDGFRHSLEVTQEVRIMICYEVLTAPLSFRCAITATTQGVVAFTSVEPTEIHTEEPGIYVAEVTIPANLLAEGEYTIGVSLFNSRGAKTWYVKGVEAVTLFVYDSLSGCSSRGDYTQNLNGVVLPKLLWQRQVGHPAYEGTPLP